MATFYIDPDYGSGGDGSESTPFDSWADVTWTAGNTYLQKRGTTAIENVTVGGSGTAANRIVIGAYGTGANPIIRPATEGSVGLVMTSRSYVTAEDIDVIGLSTWTSANTIGVRINGSASSVILNDVRTSYCGIGFDLVGGFAFSAIELNDCYATYCRADGLRCWSAAGTYTWNGVKIDGGEYRYNGVAQGANGHGLNFQVQSGHTGSVFQNIQVTNAVISDNYRAGIAIADNSVAFATITAAANTTPPTRQYRSITIDENTVQRNGGAGISVSGAAVGSISNNLVTDNSTRTTLGNIWTACSSGLSVSFNRCLRANSNGTVTGDGVGIFDDQWNDSCRFVGNYIADNVFDSAVNPEYTAYGIGIYRVSNSKHVGNVIVGCRYGFIIGYVATATAPTMAGILIANNTVIDATKECLQLWSDTPSSAVAIRNNAFSGCEQPMSAQSAGAGTQTFSNNAADRYVTGDNGANISNGCDFEADLMLDASYRPRAGSPCIGAGTYLASARHYGGKRMSPVSPVIGAHGYYAARAVATDREVRLVGA